MCLSPLKVIYNCVKDYSYIRMPIPMPMPMPRCRCRDFPGFSQFRMEKKEFIVEMETLYDFPYFLIHIFISSLLTFLIWFLVLILSSSIVDFEHLNDGWECCVPILTNAKQMAINSSKKLTRTRLFLQQPSRLFRKGLNINFRNL